MIVEFSFKAVSLNICLSILMLIISLNDVNATIYYVNDNSTSGDIYCTAIGNTSNNGTSISTPKATISQLFSSYTFISGDTIYVDAGTYNSDKNLTLNVSGVSIIGAGATSTIFDNLLAAATTNYFMYINSSNVYISGISFTGYSNNGTQTPGHSGQAITIGGTVGSPVTGVLFENISFYNNGASGGNPAISVLSYAEVTLRGGGSYCNSPGTAYTGGVELYGDNNILNIQDYILSNNDKTLFDGGGLRIEGGNNSFVNVSNTRISNNRGNEGGAISQRNGTLTMIDCIIDGNSTVNSLTHYGGAYRMHAGTSTFSRCVFSNNTGGGTSCRGGAIGARYTLAGVFSANKIINIQIDSCVFSNNNPGTKGRDIYGADGSSNNCNITAVDCQFLTPGNFNIYNDGSSPANSITATYFGTLPSASGTVTRTASPNSPFTASPTPPNFTGVCGSIVILNTELNDFYGRCEGNSIELTWQTLSERNNNYFQLSRIYKNGTSELISSMNAAGTSQDINNYQYTDNDPLPNINYYSLSQVDYDGKENQLKIISVSNDCENTNYASYLRNENSIFIRINLDRTDPSMNFEVYDITGNTIDIGSQTQFGESSYKLNLTNYPSAGVYFVKWVGRLSKGTLKVIIN